MKTFNTEFEVYFEDISPTGKIHLEKLAEWMSVAREKYFKATCPEYLKFVESPVKMFTTNMSISISGNAKWADKIAVALTSSNIKKISFEINADFKNLRSGKTVAKGLQKVAFVDIGTNNFTNIPEDLRSNVVQYQCL